MSQAALTMIATEIGISEKGNPLKTADRILDEFEKLQARVAEFKDAGVILAERNRQLEADAIKDHDRVAELDDAISKSFPRGQKIQLADGVQCEVIDVGEIVGAHASPNGIRVTIYGCNCSVADYEVGSFRMISESECEKLAASADERLAFKWTKVATLPARPTDHRGEVES